MKTEPVEADLLNQIDLDRLPRHIAIIMDGNGRWAKRRRLPRIAGHRAGIRAVRQAVEASARAGRSLSYAVCIFRRKLEAAAHGNQALDGLAARVSEEGNR